MPRIASLTEITPGEIKQVDLQDTLICVVNVAGKFLAFSDACSYDRASLSQGTLEGSTITCTCGSKFDVDSGQVLAGPATNRIRTYRVQTDGDELRI